MATSLNPSTSATRIFHLHIELLNVEPLVWRRVWVPETVKLKKLDRIIQESMGWTHSHLHAFTIEGKRYGSQEQDDWGMDANLLDEKRYAIRDVLGEVGFEFSYVYDFGDDWMHRIVVERIEAATALNNWAMCVAGENACPPEDVGGPPGYEMFRDAMADKSHPHFADYWTWTGGPFDPKAFDMNLANKRVKKLR
ncbi:MAG: plasmid pRiA4b ORF-3 family protein [Rhodoferax sp.]|nr:plasmid pRiA4b ORF-3 family protein [Rhodoferax sp.]